MATNTIPYAKTGYFSKTICDYLAQDAAIEDFYHRFPSLENFYEQIKEKAKQDVCKSANRLALVKALKDQYKNLEQGELTEANIKALSDAKTFTITTGHQLNLFTGPLYFLYKIVSVINLCKQLKQQYPEYNFVPIYWMATEDHDFDEINYFNLNGKKIRWNSKEKGAVGRFSTQGLAAVLAELKKEFGQSDFAKQLCKLFEQAYLKNEFLADATRFLGNALFGDQGLVIVDGDDSMLKKSFIPFAIAEFDSEKSFNQVSKTTARLVKAGYQEQVHPREINLFYLKEGLRERIIKKEGVFYINETTIQFTHSELLRELESHPERFSPNALLRPLYQEAILPNLCYVGGGGELAYWFQLKDYFQSVGVLFPMLLLRNSAILITQKQLDKANRLGLSISDLFKKQRTLIDQKLSELSKIPVDFSPQREHLQKQFTALYDLAKQTDASFLGAVGAQEKKQLNGLEHLEKRLKKAQKRNLKDQLERIELLQDSLFPGHSLQERNTNFSQFYLQYGSELLNVIGESLQALSQEFTVIELS